MTKRILILAVALVDCGGGSFTAAGETSKFTDVAETSRPTDDAELMEGDKSGDGDAATSDSTVDAAASDGSTTDTTTALETSPDVACTCTNDLSNAGLTNFTIAFTITTTSTTPMALLNQRATCDTMQPFWDVFTGTNGAFTPAEGVVYINLGAGGSVFDDVSTMKVVNDGQPHRVSIARTGGGTLFTLTVDGVGGTQGIAPLEALAGTLPALRQGADVCTMYAPLQGQLTDICVSIGCP